MRRINETIRKNYTPDGSWCDKCLDEVDIDLHE